MKTIPLLTFLLTFFTFSSYSQDDLTGEYNKLSIEASVGLNSPSDLFSSNKYYSTGPDAFLNVNDISHFDLGLRYMFNTKFGAKIDVAYDVFKPANNSQSLPFESLQYRIGLQGILNFGNMLNFRSFSDRLGLLVHAGVQASRFNPQSRNSQDLTFITENKGGFMFGITPQYKISDRLVLILDATLVQNERQHLTWDGVSVADQGIATDKFSKSSVLNLSAGLTFNLGKHKTHADWVDSSLLHILDDKLSRYDNQLDDIETKLLDTDKDGVLNFLDREPNTVNGVSVNTKGVTIDKNNNGISDELEQALDTKYASIDYTDKSISTTGLNNIKLDADDDLINVYFDSNHSTPEPHSIDDISKVVKYLKSYPNSVAILTGFTDEIGGNSDYNSRLSEIRAKKVHDIMVAMGISESRLTYKGGGVDASVDKVSKYARQTVRRVSVRIE